MRGFLRVAVIFALFFTGLFASHVKAEQGDVSAQYNLGVMYEKGQGVQQD